MIAAVAAVCLTGGDVTAEPGPLTERLIGRARLGHSTRLTPLHPEVLPKNTERIAEWVFDLDGRRLRLAVLAEGYTATFRNFNVQRQKATLKQLKVLGIEEVTVPAGAFKAYKLELKSAEGEPGDTTVWIATDTRKVVKIAATLPQMAGAKMTSELVP